MRSVHLKLSAGTLKAFWVLSPDCAQHFERLNVLVVFDVPDDVADVEVVRLANVTVINTPAHPREPPTVAFSRLEPGKLVNLVIGRPPGTRTARTATIPVQRCTPEERARWDALRPKLDQIGIDGMLRAIERAK